MATGREKVKKAFRAMKSLDIAAETVRPVLKRLLHLYNDDWTLIEEDNYRNLADAIFEAAEEKAVQSGAMINDEVEVEPPCKKPHRGLPEDRGSSNMDNSRSFTGKRIAESSQSLSADLTTLNDHFSCPEVAKNKSLTDALQNSDKMKKRNLPSSGYNLQTTFQTTHDIPASTCGQVKVSLTCNRAVGQQNFHHPNADDVLHYIECHYRKIYRNDDDPFAMVKLLNRLCETYLKMGADSLNRQISISRLTGNCSQPPLELSVESVRKRAVRKALDITNGTEKVEISLLNDNVDEDLSHFIYSPENIVYQSAYVQISLARISDEDCCSGCKGDCISSSLPCACARDTGGDFAYTAEGLLSEKFLESCLSMKREPQNHEFFCSHDCPLERAKNADRPEKCKGHLLRKFIKECWRKCGCSMQCANRVVQRGISWNLQVFFANEEKGWGVRTLEKLPAGAFICEYAGEILTNIELYERNERNKNSCGKEKHIYPVLLDADWATESVLKDEDALCLDATYYGNVARFINHRCFDGNLVEVPVQVETSDRHYYHLWYRVLDRQLDFFFSAINNFDCACILLLPIIQLAFFTKREVDALEELTWDYGIDFDDHNHPIKAFKCRCGSQYCRDRTERT